MPELSTGFPTSANRLRTGRLRSALGRMRPALGRMRQVGRERTGRTEVMDELPSIDDLERLARRRLPHFAWEYLASGTGAEQALERNRTRLASLTLTPRLLKGPLSPELGTELFGVRHAAPIGIAPIGLSGLIWPGSDLALARLASARSIPHVLSTVGNDPPETIGPIAGDMGWFQLYPPRDPALRDDLVARVARAGFRVLVVTADVPAPSRRERQRRARIRVPPVIGPRLVYEAMRSPRWTSALLRHGLPGFGSLAPYLDETSIGATAGFVGANLGGTLSFDYLAELREIWDGTLMVKGILHPDDARRCVEVGADAIGVSNHGGRQLDGAPSAIEALPPVVAGLGGRVPVVFDSGVRSGLDVARALALGADFVLCGRAFMFGLGALGPEGATHVLDILVEDLVNVMSQLGCERPSELADRLDGSRIDGGRIDGGRFDQTKR